MEHAPRRRRQNVLPPLNIHQFSASRVLLLRLLLLFTITSPVLAGGGDPAPPVKLEIDLPEPGASRLGKSHDSLQKVMAAVGSLPHKPGTPITASGDLVPMPVPRTTTAAPAAAAPPKVGKGGGRRAAAQAELGKLNHDLDALRKQIQCPTCNVPGSIQPIRPRDMKQVPPACDDKCVERMAQAAAVRDLRPMYKRLRETRLSEERAKLAAAGQGAADFNAEVERLHKDDGREGRERVREERAKNRATVAQIAHAAWRGAEFPNGISQAPEGHPHHVDQIAVGDQATAWIHDSVPRAPLPEGGNSLLTHVPMVKADGGGAKWQALN